MSDFEVHPVGTGALLSQLHASAPDGCKCADCTIDEEACPACYTAWWEKRHPSVLNVKLLTAEFIERFRPLAERMNRPVAEKGECVASRELRLDDLQEPVITQVMTRTERDYRRQEGWMMWLKQHDPERYERMAPVAE